MSSKNKNTKKVDDLLSDSSSEDVQVTKKTAKATRKVSAASETSKSENLLKNKRKQSKDKKAKKQESSDSESEKPKKKVTKKSKVDSDDESEKPKAKKAPAKKANYSDDSDSEVEKKTSRKNSKAKAKKTKKADSDDSDNEIKMVKNNNNNADDDNEDGHKELFVKNLSWNTTEDGLYEYFGQFGEVVNVKVLTDKMTGKPRGIAFVEFSKHSCAKKALANVGELDGREIQCSMSNDKPQRDGPPRNNGFGGNNRQGGGDSGFSGDRHTIFVGNLGFRTNEDKVRKFFSRAGNVVGVRIATHEDGKAKGFCHVDFDSQDSVQAAIGYAGQELDGREIRVDASQPRQGGGAPRGGRGGFRGGRGGGRGGFGGGIERPQHAQMGTTGTKKKFNDDSD